MHEWSLQLGSWCWRQGVVLPHNTIFLPLSVYDSTHPNADTTRHSDKRATPLGFCCISIHSFCRKHNLVKTALFPSSVYSSCKHTANPPPPPHSLNLSFTRKHPPSLLYRFYVVYVLVVDAQNCCGHSCLYFIYFFHFPFSAMTSAFLCTIPQIRPTKLALQKGWHRQQLLM